MDREKTNFFGSQHIIFFMFHKKCECVNFLGDLCGVEMKWRMRNIVTHIAENNLHTYCGYGNGLHGYIGFGVRFNIVREWPLTIGWRLTVFLTLSLAHSLTRSHSLSLSSFMQESLFQRYIQFVVHVSMLQRSPAIE